MVLSEGCGFMVNVEMLSVHTFSVSVNRVQSCPLLAEKCNACSTSSTTRRSYLTHAHTEANFKLEGA